MEGVEGYARYELFHPHRGQRHATVRRKEPMLKRTCDPLF